MATDRPLPTTGYPWPWTPPALPPLKTRETCARRYGKRPLRCLRNPDHDGHHRNRQTSWTDEECAE
ncbi:hypothetical protein [Streptomyces luteogriseus]|uniref:hypothetical protein n=1 Tax=Streptomyces luteogriseus TaxID=68233 RepID=UPI00261EBA14|nr:hypothetical protein [uncultured Streptomyces sp.]